MRVPSDDIPATLARRRDPGRRMEVLQRIKGALVTHTSLLRNVHRYPLYSEQADSFVLIMVSMLERMKRGQRDDSILSCRDTYTALHPCLKRSADMWRPSPSDSDKDSAWTKVGERVNIKGVWYAQPRRSRPRDQLGRKTSGMEEPAPLN